jgi:hypothetical protein
MPLNQTIQQKSNARINPRRAQAFNLHQRKNLENHAIEASRFNELLDFVRLDHSTPPQPSPLILAFNVTNAAGDSSYPTINSQCWRGLTTSKLEQHSSLTLPLRICEDYCAALSHSIQQESNARINPPVRTAFNLQCEEVS